MTEENAQAKCYQVGSLKVEVHPTGRGAGAAAARAAAEALIELAKTQDSIGVIFATGASQMETLKELTGMAHVPWNKIRGFHMDEYVGIAADHPASFRRYLRERLTEKVKMNSFLEIDGSAQDHEKTGREYACEIRSADPQLCLLGIGENGHLAFNDPPIADFTDPVDVKVVQLDLVCRQQQAAEGWFSRVEDVPQYAITLTIPALLRVPRLIVSVPGKRKATIVRRALTEPISTACPATILRTHPDATVYLDLESANELGDVLITQ